MSQPLTRQERAAGIGEPSRLEQALGALGPRITIDRRRSCYVLDGRAVTVFDVLKAAESAGEQP